MDLIQGISIRGKVNTRFSNKGNQAACIRRVSCLVHDNCTAQGLDFLVGNFSLVREKRYFSVHFISC